MSYETSIGNAWLFEVENSKTAIGYCFVMASEQTLMLPKAPKDRRHDDFLVPFNIEVRIVGFMPRALRYRDGRVNLGEAEGDALSTGPG